MSAHEEFENIDPVVLDRLTITKEAQTAWPAPEDQPHSSTGLTHDDAFVLPQIFKAYPKSEKKKSDKKLRKKKKPTLIIATSSPEIRIRKRKVMQPGHEKNGDLKKISITGMTVTQAKTELKAQKWKLALNQQLM